jgi:hypothetical protein
MTGPAEPEDAPPSASWPVVAGSGTGEDVLTLDYELG